MADDNVPSLPPLTGGCLCGSVRYEARPQHREGYYCHCRMCQLAFGNTRAAFVNLLKSQVTWLAPPTWYASSRIAKRGFCGTCGSPLTYENEVLPDEIHLLAGALSDPSGVKPSAHIVVKEQLPWFDAADELPRYEKWRKNAKPIRHGPRKANP